MCKTYLKISAILTGLLFFSGCLDKYTAEKALWKVNFDHAKTIRDPRSADAAEFSETVKALRLAAYSNPGCERSGNALFTLVQMYMQVGDLARAREELLNIVGRFDRPDIWRNAVIYMGNLRKAQRPAKIAAKAVNDDPELAAEPYMAVSRSLSQGNLNEAAQGSIMLIKSNPENRELNSEAIFAVGLSFEKAGQWENALQLFNTIKSIYPDSVEAMESYLIEAVHYSGTGQPAMAEASLDGAVDVYNKAASGRDTFVVSTACDFRDIGCAMQKNKNKGRL